MKFQKHYPALALCFFRNLKKWLKVCSREDTFRILENISCTTTIDSPEQAVCDAPVLQLVVVAYSKTLYIRNNATCWTANIANTFKYAWVQAQSVPMNNQSKHASTALESLLEIKRFFVNSPQSVLHYRAHDMSAKNGVDEIIIDHYTKT